MKKEQKKYLIKKYNDKYNLNITDVIDKNCKKFEYLYNDFYNSYINDIYDVYKCPSVNKTRSFYYIKKFCEKNNFDFRILGFNYFTYSVGAINWENKIFLYFTHLNNYLIKL